MLEYFSLLICLQLIRTKRKMNKPVEIICSYFSTQLCVLYMTFTICLHVASLYNLHTYHCCKLQLPLYLRKLVQFPSCRRCTEAKPSQSNCNFDSDCDSTRHLSACSLNYLIFDFGLSCRRLHMDSHSARSEYSTASE